MVLMLPVVIIRLLAIATVVIGFYTLLKIYDYSPYKPSWYFFFVCVPALDVVGVDRCCWLAIIRACRRFYPAYLQ